MENTRYTLDTDGEGLEKRLFHVVRQLVLFDVWLESMWDIYKSPPRNLSDHCESS
jgi:hypothetical protein